MNLLLLQTWTDDQLSAYIEQTSGGWMANFMPMIFWFVVAVAVLAFVASLFGMLKNPESLKSFGLGFIVILFLAAICYFTASADIPENLKQFADAGTFQLVGAGIAMVLALVLIGVLAVIFGIIKSALKL